MSYILLAIICWQPIYNTVMAIISFVQTGTWPATYTSKVTSWFQRLLSLVLSAP